MKKILVFLFCIVTLILACENDEATIMVTEEREIVIEDTLTLCDSLDVFYARDVKPILDSAGCSFNYCHGGGATSGGFLISDYVSTKTSAEDIDFMKSIKHISGTRRMPKDRDKISDQDIQIIECWIQSGSRE
jgi:hypothetical protein